MPETHQKPIIRRACPTIPARISFSKPDPPRRHSNQPDHSQIQRLKTPREKSGIYRLNEARLEHCDSGLKRPAPAFDAAQTALKEALDALFAEAQRELVALPDEAREGKALRSLLNHRDGLSAFVDRPQVPMDNNLAERVLRGPVIGRRLSFGSNSEDGARFTAIVYSVAGTLSMNGIDVLRWLEAWLDACAKNGRQPPDDLSPWLP